MRLRPWRVSSRRYRHHRHLRLHADGGVLGRDRVVTGESPLVDTTSSSLTANLQRRFHQGPPHPPATSTTSWRSRPRRHPRCGGRRFGPDDRRGIQRPVEQLVHRRHRVPPRRRPAPPGSTSTPTAIEEDPDHAHIGAPAEYGNMLGAAMNVVTKSGSNDFRGGINTYGSTTHS